jgi:hypothetical protein
MAVGGSPRLHSVGASVDEQGCHADWQTLAAGFGGAAAAAAKHVQRGGTTLPMPAEVMAALRMLNAQQKHSKAFRDHCTAAGVPVIRLHDTRHTAATRMLDSGTTVSATAKWLGHDPAMTLRVYGHVYEDALASAGDVLLGGMSPANGER